MKIAFLLNDVGTSGIDMRDPEHGNPGVGGTLYCFIALIKLLKQRHRDVLIYAFHYENNILPPTDGDIIIQNQEEIAKKTSEMSIDLLVFEQCRNIKYWCSMLEKYNVCGVLWAHNYLFRDELRIVPKCKSIKRVIFVGHEEYDSYIDSEIIDKSVYIYNICGDVCKNESIRELDNIPTVTYVGSLVPIKGFQYLAEEWPKILKAVPNARLNVIGSGKLYDRNVKLGRFGIAEERFENEIFRHLLDKNGNVINGVSFCGIVGQNKKDIFKNTWVGVVNPSSKSETFCLSAVEMEANGIPVVAGGKYGLLDTVKDSVSGYTCKNRRKLRLCIIRLLKNEDKNLVMGDNASKFVRSKFNNSIIVDEWYRVLNDAINGTEPDYIVPTENYYNDMKWLKLINRKLHLIPISLLTRDIKFMIGKFVNNDRWKNV